jgi:hypothetical protein
VYEFKTTGVNDIFLNVDVCASELHFDAFYHKTKREALQRVMK